MQALRSLKNRFAALVNDDEQGHDDTEAPASETFAPQEDNDWVRVLNKKKTAKSGRKYVRHGWMWPKDTETNGFEMEASFERVSIL